MFLNKLLNITNNWIKKLFIAFLRHTLIRTYSVYQTISIHLFWKCFIQIKSMKLQVTQILQE